MVRLCEKNMMVMRDVETRTNKEKYQKGTHAES